MQTNMNMAIQRPTKIDVGDCLVVDFEFLEDYAIMILEERSSEKHSRIRYSMVADYDRNNTVATKSDIFTNTVISQSRNKLVKLQDLKKANLKTGTVANITIFEPKSKMPATLKSFQVIKKSSTRFIAEKTPSVRVIDSPKKVEFEDKEEFPAFEGCRNLVSRSLNKVRSMNLAGNISLNDTKLLQDVATIDLDKIFNLDAEAPWQELQDHVFKNYYGSVFDRKIKKGEVYKLSVKKPEDLIDVPEGLLPQEYLKFIEKGKEKVLLNYLFQEAKVKPRPDPVEIRKQVSQGIASKEVATMDMILNRFKNHLSKLETKQIALAEGHATLQTEICSTIKQAESHTRIKKEREQAYAEAFSPESQANMPTGIRQSDKLARLKFQSRQFEKERKAVVHRKAKSLDTKMHRLDEVIKMRKPGADQAEKAQLQVNYRSI